MARPRQPVRDARKPAANAKRSGPVELVDVPRKPPRVPSSLEGKGRAAARALWRELYAEPVSDLWRPIDHALVLRVILLRRRLELEGDACPGWVWGVLVGLEDRLLLNPRARRAAGVSYVAPSALEQERATPVRLDDRRRARIARGA